jgi:hypothetical protein
MHHSFEFKQDVMKKALTLISLSFRVCVATVSSPALSKASISSVDIAFTSLATAPIDFPSFFPNTLRKQTQCQEEQGANYT